MGKKNTSKLNKQYKQFASVLISSLKFKIIQFNQKACLKSYIDMNTKMRTEAKNDF